MAGAKKKQCTIPGEGRQKGSDIPTRGPKTAGVGGEAQEKGTGD